MKSSEVVFNEFGRSIESSCLLFKNKKWHERYLLCSQREGLRSVVMYIYKNHKRRIKMKASSTLVLDSIVGVESGFTVLKQQNTVCLITKEQVLLIALTKFNNLLLWETWLNETCCRGSNFCAQLLGAPFGSRAHRCLNREIRLHIHVRDHSYV
ncbi:hypothetical protein AB6A40_008267 [Gnathostoma spinigerum]|uniref:PH domain-containing protein n=1 Tax=Gnathostoma spinigerum TaxID=75299 RepID=A0ABD6ENW3_9BILA